MRATARAAARTAWLVVALALTGCDSDSTQERLDQILAVEAQTAEQNHDYETAVRHYTTLYGKDQENQTTILGLARNLRHAGRFEDARRLLTETLARLGPKPQLLLEKGKDEIAVSRADLAAQTLETAVQGAPGEWEPAATLAIAYDRLGRYADAAAQYQAAIKLYPENADILNNYALSQALAGHIDEALALLRKAVAMPSASPRARENLALLEAMHNQPPRPGTPAIPTPAPK